VSDDVFGSSEVNYPNGLPHTPNQSVSWKIQSDGMTDVEVEDWIRGMRSASRFNG
jgi:hypothetical protein